MRLFSKKKQDHQAECLILRERVTESTELITKLNARVQELTDINAERHGKNNDLMAEVAGLRKELAALRLELEQSKVSGADSKKYIVRLQSLLDEIKKRNADAVAALNGDRPVVI